MFDSSCEGTKCGDPPLEVTLKPQNVRENQGLEWREVKSALRTAVAACTKAWRPDGLGAYEGLVGFSTSSEGECWTGGVGLAASVAKGRLFHHFVSYSPHL